MDKRVKDSRVVIGALIQDESEMKGTPHIFQSLASFMTAAWGAEPVQDLNFVLMVEGNPPNQTNENPSFVFGSTAKMEEAIGMVESKKASDRIKRNTGSGTSSPDLVLVIGSREFCQAAIHFWATSSKVDVCSRWGLHLIRRLTNPERSTVYWHDSQSGEFFQGDIGNMFKSLKEKIQ